MKYKIFKVIRYVIMIGLNRTIVKSIARTRPNISLPKKIKNRNISIIGCGQFSFSTIAYYLYLSGKYNILGVYDYSYEAARSLAKFYNIDTIYTDSHELIADRQCKLVYIASNHSTHTPYALSAIESGLDIFIEKPIATTYEQFKTLNKALVQSKNNIFVGYNRPFSKAINQLSKIIKHINQPFSLSCFIIGHYIGKDHWYRNPEEGTRVCGNMGHWIDLSIHLLSVVYDILPEIYDISISSADIDEPDDNIAISITSDKHDIISIFISSRCEPFEGINETINFQCANIIAKIDDFRKMVLWQDHKKTITRYWPKDVGHKRSVLQPFNKVKRDFNEIRISTIFMLIIKDMVLDGQKLKRINLNTEITRLLS